MANKQKYDIRCVESDGSDYSCETFASREAAEQQIKSNPHYRDKPPYEHYYVCPAGVSDVPNLLDNKSDVEPKTLNGQILDAYFDGLKHIYEDY